MGGGGGTVNCQYLTDDVNFLNIFRDIWNVRRELLETVQKHKERQIIISRLSREFE
jgi:hypothetical protein